MPLLAGSRIRFMHVKILERLEVSHDVLFRKFFKNHHSFLGTHGFLLYLLVAKQP